MTHQQPSDYGSPDATGRTELRSRHGEELSTPQLISQVAEQTSALVRDEMQLAKAELSEAAKKAGLGAGLFGTAGVIALYGGWAAVLTVIFALALVMDIWLAALIVTVLLFAAAGVAALLGRSKVKQAAPPVKQSQESVQRDIDTLKERSPR